MPTPQRPRETGLIRRLFAEPWRFGLLPAVTLLLRWLARRGMPKDAALATAVRFENTVSLAFPASEIEALRADGERIVMTPTGIGFLGAAGTLPLHDTERCARAASAGQPEGRAFLDHLSTRMVTLFWQAWALHRPEVGLDTGGGDAWRPCLQALAGQHVASREANAWYAGLLRVRPVSAATLECILAGELGLPVRVESMAGCWETLPVPRRSTLGAGTMKLGAGATLGARQWRLDRRVRIVIGPLSPDQFEWLLPRGEGARIVAGLLGLAMAQVLAEYEVRLLPDARCMRPLVLTARPGAAPRLGWDTVLADAPGRSRQRDVRYLLKPRLFGEIR